MRPIPKPVLLAFVFCTSCVVVAGLLAISGMNQASHPLVIVGFAIIMSEIFRWGALSGFPVSVRAHTLSVVNIARCVAMGFILFFASASAGGVVLFAVYALFFRRQA